MPSASYPLIDMQLPIAGLSLHSIQFAAILGDLSHKTEVYLARQSYSTYTTCLFANCEQAGYLLSSSFQLPPGSYNNHSLGTFFVFFHYSNLTFRFDYLAQLPSLSCYCV